MTAVKLTPTVEAVLRGVARGEVIHTRSMRTDKPDLDRWQWAPGASRKVAREMAKLDDAGFVAFRIESGRLSAPWQLTEAGERWLAENGEKR